MKYAIVAALLLPLATAHLCLLSPEQRGTISGLGTPGKSATSLAMMVMIPSHPAGADDCKLLSKDCGGRDPGPVAVTLWYSQLGVCYTAS